jgi:uncharacterized membrane protein
MQFPRLLLPTTLAAFGLFLLMQGIDSLKVEHLGIRLLTIQWLAQTSTLSYHTVGITCAVIGFAFMFAGAEICRRADKRIVAAIPGIKSPRSFRFVIPVAFLFAMIGSYIVSTYDTRASNQSLQPTAGRSGH